MKPMTNEIETNIKFVYLIIIEEGSITVYKTVSIWNFSAVCR